MSDDLRQRYTEALAATCRLHEVTGSCNRCERRLEAVMAVRDEELERLREEAAYCVEALNGAENRRQAWRERAERVERRLAEIRRYIDEDFRFWCSPHGVAGRYAKDLVAYIDRLDDQDPDRA